MSSAMEMVQEAEKAVKAVELKAKEEAGTIIVQAQLKAENLMKEAKKKAKDLSSASFSDAQEKAKKKVLDGKKEIEASIFREKEAALSRKDSIVSGIFQSLVNEKI